MEERRLDRLTSSSAAAANADKAILPLGSTEFHGPHLPYGSDTFGAEALSHAFANAMERTLVLPAMPYGVTHHHLSFPWTVSVRPQTLALMVADIGESLLSHGIRKLVIVSAHDGNHPVAQAAARQISQDHQVSVAVFTGWQRRARALLEGARTIDLDHAGQSETSLMLYAVPELVRPDVAPSEASEKIDYAFDLIGEYRDNVPSGYSGNAAAASEEEGRAIVSALVDIVVAHVRRLDEHGWRGGEWLSGIKPTKGA